MAFKSCYSILLASAAFLSLGIIAKAANPPTPVPVVYLVYSGTANAPYFSASATSTATVKNSSQVYMILTLPHQSGYSLMLVNSNHSYYISTRVPSADGTSLTGYDVGHQSPASVTQNFTWGMTSAPSKAGGPVTAGRAVLRMGIQALDSITINNAPHGYPQCWELYATGSLAGLTSPVTLVPANAKSRVSGVYTINPVPTAFTNYIGTPGNASLNAYPSSLTGPLFSYNYDPTVAVNPNAGIPALESFTISGTVSMTLNTTLTALANAGGSFKLKGQTVPTTINPIAAPLTSASSPTVYEDFLYQVTLSLGLPSGYIPNP